MSADAHDMSNNDQSAAQETTEVKTNGSRTAASRSRTRAASQSKTRAKRTAVKKTTPAVQAKAVVEEAQTPAPEPQAEVAEPTVAPKPEKSAKPTAKPEVPMGETTPPSSPVSDVRLDDAEDVMNAKRQVMSSSEALKIAYAHGRYPYRKKIGTEQYEAELKALQIELLKVQNWVKMTGQRIVALFEGRDAAGKGGTIKRFMEHLNPRAAHVVALEKPTEREQGQWYFQRYLRHLPTKGEMVLFDRSWYNRTGVERVMGFCSPTQYLEFLRQVPDLERMLVNDGVILYKYWFSVSRYEQLRRFHARKLDPLKQWKLSPIDIQSLQRWDDYTKAKEAMFFYTDTADAPWTVVKSDDKKRARIHCMRHFLSRLDYPDKNEELVNQLDPKIVATASAAIDKDEHPVHSELHLDAMNVERKKKR